MDELIINAKMDTKGFEAGTKRLASAIKSFGSNVDRSMKQIQGAGKSVLSTIMKWGPALLGVGGAYSIISKSVSAFMSQNQQLQGTLTSCWTAIGNMLGPIITSIVNMIATVVSYLVTFLNLLGLTTKTASQAGQKAGGAAQQLKKQLMGFDELNVMQDNQGGGGGAGGGLQDIDPSDWMKKLADLLKNKMWDEAADMVIERLNDIIYSFRDKAEEWGKIAGEWIQGITHFIARILDETDWKQLGVGIANLLNGLLAEVEGINFGEDLGKIIAAKFTIAFKIVTGFLEQFNFERLGYIISELVKSMFDAMSRAIAQANPALIGQNIAKFFNNIDWVGIANSISGFLKDAWSFGVTALHNFITSVNWHDIGAGIRQFFQNIDWKQIKEDLKMLLEDAWDAAIDFLWGLMAGETEEEAPLIKSLMDIKKTIFEELIPAIETFVSTVWEQKLKPVLEWSITEGLPKLIKDVADTLQDLAKVLKDGDWSGFKDGLNGVEAALLAIGSVKVANGILNVTKKVSGLISLFSGGAAGATTAAGVAGAASEASVAAMGFADACLLAAEVVGGAGAAGLAMYGVSLVDAKLSTEYTTQAMEEAGQSSIGLAEKLNELAETASHYDECLYDTTGYTTQMGWSLQESRYAAEAMDSVIAELAKNLGLTTDELKAQIEAAGGDATKIAALSDEVAQARAKYEELGQILDVMKVKYGEHATEMVEYQEVQKLMTEIADQYNLELDEQGKILEKTKMDMQESAAAADESAAAAERGTQATLANKQAQEQMQTAMQGAKQESQNLVTGAQNLESEMSNLAQSGSTAGTELTEGYTDTVNANAPAMKTATTEAGAEGAKGMADGIKESTPEAEAATKEMVTSVVEIAKTEVQSGTQEINSIVQSSVSLITNTIQNCESMVTAAVTGSRNLITQSFNAIQSTVTSTMNAVNSIIIQVFNSMIQMSGQAGMAIANNFAAGMTELYNAASNVAVSLNDVLGSYFSQIAQNGYVWGSDLGILFNNGLVDACNAYLIPTLSQVAQSIKNVIGFSKPKEGPLSDADTYMPDFMKLMADGVEENMDRPLGAISDLAEGVKEELQDGDYTFGDFEAGELDTAFAAFGTQFLDGFGLLVDRLDAIAERVIYQLPEVAAGTVLPYGVAAGNAQGITGNDVNLRDVLTAIDGLRTFLSTNSGENQGLSVNVFLDGEQIETAVSTRQRRKSMARGA